MGGQLWLVHLHCAGGEPVTSWNSWPRSHIREFVRGSVYDGSYHIDECGVLHVSHSDAEGVVRVRTFKLVEVKPAWVEVEDGL
jgi:hypothetical protein